MLLSVVLAVLAVSPASARTGPVQLQEYELEVIDWDDRTSARDEEPADECWGEWVCGFYLATADWCDEQMNAAQEAAMEGDAAASSAYLRSFYGAGCPEIDADIREHCLDPGTLASFFPDYCWD